MYQNMILYESHFWGTYQKKGEKVLYFILKSPRNILYKASMHNYMILGNIIFFDKLIIDYTSKVPTRLPTIYMILLGHLSC